MLDGIGVPGVLYIAGLYGAGVLWGLVLTDARPAGRVGLALLWPLGPIAFVLTVAMLLVVSPLAFLRRT